MGTLTFAVDWKEKEGGGGGGVHRNSHFYSGLKYKQEQLC